MRPPTGSLPLRIATTARSLGDAGVTWPTVERLAVVARIAGLRPMLELGDRIVDGPRAGVDAVRTVLRGLVDDPAPHDVLHRIAVLLRQLSVAREQAPDASADVDAGKARR